MTKQKSPILVPVDFSSHSEAALLQASEFAGCMNKPLLILHVVHDPGDMPGYYARIAKKKQLVRIEDIAQEMLDAFLESLCKRHPKNKPLRKAEKKLVVGLPVTRILEVAERANASMVVMGSQGRTGLEHLMLGSKAEQVVRLAPLPVLIVK